ncbi:MAG: hypothetical protein R2849_21840 [Thermomicrobiales bacterium]
MGILLVRTDRDAPKHQGISWFDRRHAPAGHRGTPTAPDHRHRGRSCWEVFFTNVRVPADNLTGELNTGWRIAQTTPPTSAEASFTMGIVARLEQSFDQAPGSRRAARRDGLQTDDPLRRRKLGQIKSEIAVLRYASLRILSAVEKGRHPGPESSISKPHYPSWTSDSIP